MEGVGDLRLGPVRLEARAQACCQTAHDIGPDVVPGAAVLGLGVAEPDDQPAVGSHAVGHVAAEAVEQPHRRAVLTLVALGVASILGGSLVTLACVALGNDLGRALLVIRLDVELGDVERHDGALRVLE